MRAHYKVPFIIIMVLLALSTGRHVALQAQAPIAKINVTEINSAAFPQIVVRFRALDNLAQPVQNLGVSDIAVTENNEPMAVEGLTTAEAGLWVHFVIEAGAGLTPARWADVQTALLSFVQTTPWMQGGLDNVAITVIEAGGARLLADYTNNTSSLAAAIENYRPPGGGDPSDPLPAVSTLLDEMDLLAEAKGQAKVIFLFSSGLEKRPAALLNSTTSKAQDLQIPIYTVLFRETVRACRPDDVDEDGNVTRYDCDEAFQAIGQNTGAAFVHYRDRNSLNGVYRTVTNQRLQYDLTYRTFLSVSGTRPLKLAARVGPAGGVAGESSYTVEINPPRVLIESPRSNEIIVRQSAVYTTDIGSIAPQTQSVVANVIFPDGFERRIVGATLFVNNAARSEADNPSAGLEFSWNLRDVTALGINDYVLQVEIEDELGFKSKSPETLVKVEVVVPPPSPATPGGTSTPPPPPTPTPIPCISPEPICSTIEGPLRSNPTSFISLGVALLALVFAGTVWFNRDKAPVRAVRETIRTAIDTVTKRIQRSEARAYLKVIAGDVSVGKTLEIYGDTPIGRSRQNAELLFQYDNENSPLSRLHCTILDEEDHFKIRDEDSANGTYLNGVRLKPLVPEDLEDGDEIELARVERGGVHLQFLVARYDENDDNGFTRNTQPTRRPAANGDDAPPAMEEDRF